MFEAQGRSVEKEGRLAIAGGVVANVLPIVGWTVLAFSAKAADSASTATTATAGIGAGAVFAIALGIVAVFAWIGGMVMTLLGLSRSTSGSAGRTKVFVGGAFAVLAGVTWIVEWMMAVAWLTSGEHSGGFRM